MPNVPTIFTTEECAWKSTSVAILGKKIVGISAFDFKKGIDKEHLFAAGDQPLDIQTGNVTPSGSITVLKFEFDKLNDIAQAAGYDDISDVPHPLISITCQFKKYKTSPIYIITAMGVAFQDWTVGQKQNDKKTDIQLPFLCMRVVSVRV